MRKRSEIRSYQEKVVTHLYERDSAMAVLTMGAGKTASAATAIQELLRDGMIRHALILAPRRVASLVWPAELAAWEHTAGLRSLVQGGLPARRMEHLATLPQRHITILGIDHAQWLCEQLAQLPDDHPIFDLLVIDETSRLKDPGSKRGRALAKQARRFKIRWGLTGTPRPNSLMDLWGQFRVIAPDLWPGSFYKWRQRHFRQADYMGFRWEPLPGSDDQLMAEAASVSITLAEGEMPDLPAISRLVEEVVLPLDVRHRYDDMERKLFAQIPDGELVVAASAGVATGKLAQISNGFLYDEQGEAHRLHEAKREWLEEKLADLGNEPAILVYEFLPDRAMILETIEGRGARYGMLGGGVGTAAGEDAVAKWNGRKIRYLIMHPASGGHGLNLQAGGRRMLWIAPTWSPELWEQTLARLHRPGQPERVMVHVCCAHGTIDHMKRLRVINKLSAQEAYKAYLRERDLQRKRIAA